MSLIVAGIQPVCVVLAERGDDPARALLTAEQLQAAWQQPGDATPLKSLMASLSRPTRIVRGKQVGNTAIRLHKLHHKLHLPS